ncbi:MAG: hypothetical protein QW279_07080 [Candidatus Jordarchaeaceae archaeon]
MSNKKSLMLLVGDNPFHGISHLSQERSKSRNKTIGTVDYAANIVAISLENGANGFMFSVSETTLSILRKLLKNGKYSDIKLYAIVPYAYEYVRLATQVGGISALGIRLGKNVLLSRDLRAMAMGLRAIISMNPEAIMKAYLFYEISRIKSAVGKTTNLESVVLHEIITEIALAFNLDWFFKSYIKFLRKLGITPGFETRNFAYLVHKFKNWDIGFNDICLVTAFNKVGFQMNPSKIACEQALLDVSESNVIAMSILASGYLQPFEAIEYIRDLPNLSGVVVGVSKESQAKQTFQLLRNQLIAIE